MVRPIVLKSTPAPWGMEGGLPEGLKVTHVEGTYTNREGENVPFSYNEYEWPEAGDARYWKERPLGGVVVPINGVRYHVIIQIQSKDDRWGDGGIPSGATVIFFPTDEEETPFETWDHDAEVACAVEEARDSIEQEREALRTEGVKGDELEREVKQYCEHEYYILDKAQKGTLKLDPPHYLQMFGQPRFIQNPVFPAHAGRSAMHLATINNNWGDAGNVNILFTCDANGVPNIVWFEASCC